MLIVNASIQGKLGMGSWGKNVVSGGDINQLRKEPTGITKMQAGNIKKQAGTHSQLVQAVNAKTMSASVSTTASVARGVTPPQVETGSGDWSVKA